MKNITVEVQIYRKQLINWPKTPMYCKIKLGENQGSRNKPSKIVFFKFKLLSVFCSKSVLEWIYGKEL